LGFTKKGGLIVGLPFFVSGYLTAPILKVARQGQFSDAGDDNGGG